MVQVFSIPICSSPPPPRKPGGCLQALPLGALTHPLWARSFLLCNTFCSDTILVSILSELNSHIGDRTIPLVSLFLEGFQ